MQSAVVRLCGPLQRSELEARLIEQITAQSILRLKGRAWLPGKAIPLQIQAVGPRLECWFDATAPGQAVQTEGLELVALGLELDARSLQLGLEALLPQAV